MIPKYSRYQGSVTELRSSVDEPDLGTVRFGFTVLKNNEAEQKECKQFLAIPRYK